MKTILLTGGAGFIGGNLTRHLLQRGYTVICLDNFDPFYDRRQKELNIRPFLGHPNYTLIEGDIRNVEQLVKSVKVEIIIHLAAKAGVRQSIETPMLYHEVNIAGTQHLLEYARNGAISQFIFASSSSVYGINKNAPWREDEHLHPISPYAASKLADEMLGHVYSHLYGIRFISLRLFTVYGPGQRPDLAISRFFKSIINEYPVTLFGDGKSYRDYTYVDDIVNGMIAAIDYRNSDFEIINLGNSRLTTLTDLLYAIEKITGKKANIERYADQPGDVPLTCADITKAGIILNYKPATSLEEGLERFYKWYLSNCSVSCEYI